MIRTTSSLAAASVLATAALAQANWTQLSPAIAPTARAGVLGVTDGTGMLVFGGLLVGGTIPTYDDAMWRFDGTNWTSLVPAVRPTGRDFYAGAYDATRQRYVLFGGRIATATSTTSVGDTWEFDGTNWTQVAPAIAPSARQWSAMTYDSARSVCVLFGGNLNGGTTYYNDTWTWDGSTWTQLAPAVSPSLRGRGFFSYDFTRGEAIYFGGRNSAAALGNTWKWDGANWSQIVTATAPGSGGVAGLFAYGFSYDFLRDRHVLFGGTRTGATLATTWEFDGTNWTQRTPATSPASRTGPAVVFAPGLGKTLMFGGFQTATLGDTWEYQTAQFATTTAIGTGCTGSGGTLNYAANNQPWLGGTFTATATNLGIGSLVFNVIGFSRTSWVGGALPLPIALVHPAGGPGCSLFVSNDAVALVPNLGGPLTTALTTPNAPVLAGLALYEQILEIEFSGANIAAINSSNGLEVIFGAR